MARPAIRPGQAEKCALRVPAGTDLVEWYFEQGWTDGLPVVPPTRALVDAFVEALGGDPQFIECKVPPRHGSLTREVLAINMVMAGCKAEYAPVVAVLGNNDQPDVAAWGAAETAALDLDGLSVAMVHDSGASAGRLVRMRRRFPSADLVVFGHSHIPLDESAPGLRIFNPGSPTDRRRQPHGTLGVLQIDSGRLTEASIVPVT